MTTPTARTRATLAEAPDLESELRQAVADIECGDYVGLTPEQLENWAETGELPWSDESHD